MSGPIEELLEITEEILEKERELRRTRLINFGGYSAILFGPVLVFAFFVTTVLTWRSFDMARIFCLIFPVAIVSFVGLFFYVQALVTDQFDPADKLKLEVSLLKERRRLQSADLSLEARYARSAYKDQIQQDLRSFKGEGKYYRRIHNWLQSVIIIGSLAITTISGIALDGGILEWLAVGTSVAVGLAAGFTGYFKFRERSFYLQQTADSLEQEWAAAELSIFRYKGLDDEKVLEQFVEEAERIKAEQRKREQSLAQPSDQHKQTGT